MCQVYSGAYTSWNHLWLEVCKLRYSPSATSYLYNDAWQNSLKVGITPIFNHNSSCLQLMGWGLMIETGAMSNFYQVVLVVSYFVSVSECGVVLRWYCIIRLCIYWFIEVVISIGLLLLFCVDVCTWHCESCPEIYSIICCISLVFYRMS